MPSRRNAVADRYRDPLGVPAVPPAVISPSGKIALVVIPETDEGREMMIDLPRVVSGIAAESGVRSTAELAMVLRYDPLNDETEVVITATKGDHTTDPLPIVRDWAAQFGVPVREASPDA